MTFRDAIRSLDDKGDTGAKRPSMLGYAVKTAIPDGGHNDYTVVVKGRGDDAIAFRVVNGEVTLCLPDGGEKLGLTSEQFNAFVLANDWETADAAELEKVRTGAGGM